MERFINLLVIDNDEKIKNGLKEILSGNGNNLLFVNSISEALPILSKKEIGILLMDVDSLSFKGLDDFIEIKSLSIIKNIYIIAITKSSYAGVKMVKGLNEGAIDYITKPFNPNFILAKIEVYKTLFYKDQRINQLLNNIFPTKVLDDLNKYGKFSPKRVENGVVLFTDFVKFSKKASQINPLQLLKKLEYFFTQFDEIINRYKLEKIKTIGDSYMVIGGVTEQNNVPAIRACLAAIEIRNFMTNEKSVAEAMQQDFWEIRIGIHMGPLVAGIIGTEKISFDVWGDTVNIASRAEQISSSNTITITNTIAENISNYFKIEPLGQIEIKKRGGKINMFTVEKLKNEYSLYNEGKIANVEIRNLCQLSNVDFDHMRKDLLNRLKSSLPEEVVYHDIAHTLNVEKSAIRFAKLEGLNEEEMMLLRTAVLYHDSGYIVQSLNNECFAINFAKLNLPKFGYSEEQIETVIKIIEATQHDNKRPKTLLEQIMCDADHDYFGRADYYAVSKKLRIENENFGKIMTENEWVEYQLNYLENIHQYYTETAKNIRSQGKTMRIQELKNLN